MKGDAAQVKGTWQPSFLDAPRPHHHVVVGLCPSPGWCRSCFCPGPGFQGSFLGWWGLNPARCQPGCQHTPCGGRGVLLAPWHHLWTLAQPHGKTGSAHLPGNAEQPGSHSTPAFPDQPAPAPGGNGGHRGAGHGVSGTPSTRSWGELGSARHQRRARAAGGREGLPVGEREDKDRDVLPQPPAQSRAERPGTAPPARL